MNNFEKHYEAQALADSKSAYALAREIIELRQETAALAAHVERLAGLWNAFCMCHEDEHGAYGARLNAAFGEALARLTAEKQAEALGQLMPAICDVADRAEVRSLRDELRSQAEESS